MPHDTLVSDTRDTVDPLESLADAVHCVFGRDIRHAEGEKSPVNHRILFLGEGAPRNMAKDINDTGLLRR